MPMPPFTRNAPSMKFRIMVGSFAWLLVISLLHVSLNVGWKDLWHDVKVLFGQERRTLLVGFLPVT